jgi:ATP-binding cassette subfamily G (WHITE) protein 8 (sterolin 2)
LQYQAKLRFSNLPSQKSSTEFIQNRVEEVIQLLGLSRCAHIQVGNEEKKGISGGEQKRLSIGIQLLNDPLICLFDEPTTGLDSFTAKHIVQTLKSLTLSDTKTVGSLVSSPSSSAMRESINSSPYPSSSFLRRRTVLMSIHQPRYDIFELIDEVTLLSRGELIWSGPVKEMFSHFEALGYPCPALVNPADFILDISSVDVRDLSS